MTTHTPSIADMRRDYTLQSLRQKDIHKNPFTQFSIWWEQALKADITDMNAMYLATVNKDDMMPSIRTVLLKEFNDHGFVFYTNYESQKARDVASHPFASILFFWKELERQVRITGHVHKTTPEESTAYFASRPYGSQISAWASPQSTKVNNRTILEDNVRHYEQQYPQQVPRPPHWGGYIIQPVTFEFWQGRASRLHDRIVYEKNENMWLIHRIAP